MACILLWSSAVRVHDSQAYRKMNVTRERISRILELREILLSIQTGFSVVNAAVAWTNTLNNPNAQNSSRMKAQQANNLPNAQTKTSHRDCKHTYKVPWGLGVSHRDAPLAGSRHSCGWAGKTGLDTGTRTPDPASHPALLPCCSRGTSRRTLDWALAATCDGCKLHVHTLLTHRDRERD